MVAAKDVVVEDREMSENRTGGCLCGGVRYTIKGELRGVVNCFCSQCQKTSGHHVAATRAGRDQLTLENSETLTWYRSSETARRGFCRRCGGNLFWERVDNPTSVSIMAGTIDAPTHLKTIENIYCDDASDYLELPLVDKD